MAKQAFDNHLYFGDNIDILRKLKDESIDLCYVDPPFNSNRTYNQIYLNHGEENKAQSQAFTDTWEWDDAAIRGYEEIIENEKNRFTPKTILLIKGLKNVLGADSLLSYLIHITLRVTEINRILKPTGSFYLHCDTTASHYLKIVVDSIFVSNGGDFRNEIAWHYSGWNKKLSYAFEKRHDCILFYGKSDKQVFNSFFEEWESKAAYVKKRKQKVIIEEGTNREYVLSDGGAGTRIKRYLDDAISEGVVVDDVWEIDKINNSAKEKLGYPTQKPEALLERIIKASSKEGDVVLDAYCGCGTTVAVAQKLNRKWIGIDITYQSISLILWRLERSFGKTFLETIDINGVPKDWESAKSLAEKKDDKARKEFEKWAILFYSDNKARINEKKGADGGIDGIALIQDYSKDMSIVNKKIVFSVKSDKVLVPAYVNQLKGKMHGEGIVMGILLCLYEPTKGMIKEAKEMGVYKNTLFNMEYPALQIISVKEMFNPFNKRLNIPVIDVVKKAEIKENDKDKGKLFGK